MQADVKKMNLRSGSECHRHFLGFFSTDTEPLFLLQRKVMMTEEKKKEI